jgi:hypothetical protein
MENDRRGFLGASAVGLATLLVPNISLASFCPPRRRVDCQPGIKMTSNAFNCPSFFAWSSTNPYIPDAQNITPSNPHNITVYGTGLVTWALSYGGFYIWPIQDESNSSVAWGQINVVSLAFNPTLNLDALTFSASETGASAGSSNITITISLSRTGGCMGSWTHQPVKYV